MWIMSRDKNDENLKGFRRAIGARLGALREMHEMQQGQFAAQIGVLQSSYAKWELGMQFPNEGAMLQLCVKYQVDFNYIYMGTFGGVDGERALKLVPLIKRRLEAKADME
jgi:transcriptional regulator with XRE-family HTH domain